MTATPQLTQTGTTDVPARGAPQPEAPVPAPTPSLETRRRPAPADAERPLALGTAAVAALAMVWICYTQLLPFSGPVGFWLLWYAVFLLVYTVLTLTREGRLVLTDRLAAVAAQTAGLLVGAALILVVGYTAFRGWRAIRPSFFTSVMAFTGPLEPLTQGGAKHAIVGTLEQVGLAVLVSVPLAVATALYLHEVGGRLARTVRTVVDAMSALPSVVAGLFVFATWILTLGRGKTGLAAALAISVMMLPIITRTSEVVLRLVPDGLREASYALGASQWRTVWHVVLPTARAGLLTAVVLGVARGVGETAPVLLTSGVTQELNADPLHGPQLSLPLFIYTLVRSPQQTMITRAYGGALTLLVLVLVLFVIARALGGRAPGQLSRRQRTRLSRTNPSATRTR